MNRARLGAVAVLLFAVLLAGRLAGQETVKLEITSDSPEAAVYIDRKPMGRTPLSLPYFSPGNHKLRVGKEGMALETDILLKSGPAVVIMAKFDSNSFAVVNQNELNYKPLQGSTRVIATPTHAGVRAPDAAPPAQPEPKPEPRPEPKPEPVKPAPVRITPKPKPEPAQPKPPPKPEPQTATPVPASSNTVDHGAILNPIPWGPSPDFSRPVPAAPTEAPAEPVAKAPAPEPVRPTPQPAPVRITPRNPAKPEPKPEVRPAPKPEPKPAPAVHPCPAPPTKDCDSFDNGIRGTVYKYYCLLSHQDFDRAYRYRTSTNGLAWFYDVAGSFCQVHNYEIRGFEAHTTSPTEAEATYIVDLKDESGQVIESWKMSTTLERRGDYWLIDATTGQKLGP